MSRCVISPSASRDLNTISDYFLERNIEAGEQLLREFNQKCQNLMQFPNMGRQYFSIREGLRGIPLNGYIIFYRLLTDGVEIMRVVSGRQDLKGLFSDGDE